MSQDFARSKQTGDTVDIPRVVGSVPRHRFVSPELHRETYASESSSSRKWQGIPPDRVVVKMVEALEIDRHSRVLEFGTGLGFTAAVLGCIADEVYTVGRDAQRRASAREHLRSMGLDGVHVLAASNYQEDLPDEPFDAILVSVVNANPPRSLLDRLTPEGRLVVLLEGEDSALRLAQVRRAEDGEIEKRSLGEVRFSFLVGDILVDMGAVSRSRVEKAARRASQAGRPLGQLLLEQGAISEDELYEALALQHGIGHGDPADLAARSDLELVGSASSTSLQHRQVIPIRQVDERLELASVDPDPPRAALLREFGADEMDVQLVGPTAFRKLWDYLDLGELRYWRSPDPAVEEVDPADDVYHARLRTLFQTILRDVIAEEASDVHLEDNGDGVRVRFRIDGDLQEVEFYALTRAKFERLREIVKVQADLAVTERERPQAGRIARRIDGARREFRILTQPTGGGENLVVRRMPGESERRPISELGYPDPVAKRYRRHLDEPSGLVLVVGPRDAGKTTSLFAGLEHYLERPARKVATLEQPITYAVDGIEQTEVEVDDERGIGGAIESLVERDLDVLVVQELRDEGAVRQACRASQTGRVVVSTMYARDTAEAIGRLDDLGLAAGEIASELKGVFAQRLARTICDGCRKRVDPEESVLAEVFPAGPPEEFPCYGGEGCVRCRGRGVRGRVPVVEYLRIGPEMRRGIEAGEALDDLRVRAREAGMRSLKQAALRLVRNGVIPVSEVPRLLGEEFLRRG